MSTQTHQYNGRNADMQWRWVQSGAARATGALRSVGHTLVRRRLAVAVTLVGRLPRPTTDEADVPFALQIIPAVDTNGSFASIKGALQAMAVPGGPGRRCRQRAIAVELVGLGDVGNTRAFVVRTTSPEALADAAVHLRARYPQASIRLLPPDEDALRLDMGEAASAVELRHQGPPFLALETFDHLARVGAASVRGGGGGRGIGLTPQHHDSTDPIIGMLAALDQVPPGMRVIAQLALTSASDQWSVGVERVADRSSLNRWRSEEQARDRIQERGSTHADPLFPLLLAGIVLLPLVLLWQRARRGAPPPWSWIPRFFWSWLRTLGMDSASPAPPPSSPPAARNPFAPPGTQQPSTHVPLTATVGPHPVGAHALHASAPTAIQPVSLLGIVAMALALVLVGLLVVWGGRQIWLRLHPLLGWHSGLSAGRRPVYDPALVARKAQEPAYHCRLRLMAIGPRGATAVERQMARGLRERYLARLAAAYRQYHVANGGFFTVRRLWRAEALLPRSSAATVGCAADAAEAAGVLKMLPARRRNTWSRGLAAAPMVLSVSEVAALWHLPIGGALVELPGIRNSEHARAVLAPPLLIATTVPTDDHFSRSHLSRAGAIAATSQRNRAAYVRSGQAPAVPDSVDAGSILRQTTLGLSHASGRVVAVVPSADLFSRHTLAVAKTGKGKSALLQALAALALSAAPPASPAHGQPLPSARLPDGPQAHEERGESGDRDDTSDDSNTHAGNPGADRGRADRGRADVVAHHHDVAHTSTENAPRRHGALTTLHALARQQQNPLPGLVVLDPHGDLIDAVLGVVPAGRASDVVVLDLADVEYPVGINPLDVTLGRSRDRASENILLILSKIWVRFWGPRMENALEYALKTLYEANATVVARDPENGPDLQFTLLDVAPLLQEERFRRRVLTLVTDYELVRWWARYYERLDTRMRLEIINPVLTKLAKFAGSQIARRIVGQGRTTLDMAEIIARGQVLLVHTARGLVGADTAALIGATILGLLRVTLEEQARLPPHTRRRIQVLIDEFQTIPGADYGAMLAELRKFGASFVLAAQTLATLDAADRDLRKTVLANIDNLLVFQVSADDARLLEGELDGMVSVHDLINLQPLTCYAKLSHHGTRLPVFSLTLYPPQVGAVSSGEMLRAASRARVASHTRQQVDEALEQLAARHTSPEKLHRWLLANARAAASPQAATAQATGDESRTVPLGGDTLGRLVDGGGPGDAVEEETAGIRRAQRRAVAPRGRASGSSVLRGVARSPAATPRDLGPMTDLPNDWPLPGWPPSRDQTSGSDRASYVDAFAAADQSRGGDAVPPVIVATRALAPYQRRASGAAERGARGETRAVAGAGVVLGEGGGESGVGESGVGDSGDAEAEAEARGRGGNLADTTAGGGELRGVPLAVNGLSQVVRRHDSQDSGEVRQSPDSSAGGHGTVLTAPVSRSPHDALVAAADAPGRSSQVDTQAYVPVPLARTPVAHTAAPDLPEKNAVTAPATEGGGEVVPSAAAQPVEKDLRARLVPSGTSSADDVSSTSLVGGGVDGSTDGADGAPERRLPRTRGGNKVRRRSARTAQRAGAASNGGDGTAPPA